MILTPITLHYATRATMPSDKVGLSYGVTTARVWKRLSPPRWVNSTPSICLTHIGIIWNMISGISCLTVAFACLLPPAPIGSSAPTIEYMCKPEVNLPMINGYKTCKRVGHSSPMDRRCLSTSMVQSLARLWTVRKADAKNCREKSVGNHTILST